MQEALETSTVRRSKEVGSVPRISIDMFLFFAIQHLRTHPDAMKVRIIVLNRNFPEDIARLAENEPNKPGETLAEG